MKKTQSDYKSILEGKNCPVVILDNKYHRLIKRINKTNDIDKAEKELSELVKKQGQLNNDIKTVKKLKTKLMQEIVEYMESSPAKVDENKRLVDEANERIELIEDELMELPREIDQKNKELLIMVMEKCYDILEDNTDEIVEVSKWIDQMRIQLKENVIKKQEMEITNVEIYTYMHDILGADVIDTFDIKYDIEARREELINKQKAKKEQALLMAAKNKEQS